MPCCSFFAPSRLSCLRVLLLIFLSCLIFQNSLASSPVFRLDPGSGSPLGPSWIPAGSRLKDTAGMTGCRVLIIILPDSPCQDYNPSARLRVSVSHLLRAFASRANRPGTHLPEDPIFSPSAKFEAGKVRQRRQKTCRYRAAAPVPVLLPGRDRSRTTRDLSAHLH